MVKRDLAAVHIVKAHQQIDDGRFARARRTHNGHKRALRHMQREVFDDLSVLCVAEVYVRKVYVALGFGEVFGIRTVRDLGLFIQ